MGRLLAGQVTGRSCAVRVRVTELVGYGDGATCKAAQPARFATAPSVPGFGFPMWPGNEWEFHMARNIARE
ncbi:hypothetical protein KEC55_25480 [Burkholderia cepacia]|uniref:hypothetical protein n=1 Tax=Burkholderia cepacia TaxID=292 RepID=UPI00249E33C2|nr:hypothetical protein [Burkholderia cepacia]WGY70395.1 hypothetical protein KEC55_25480 [Burkholderia cepacia]